MSALGLAIMIVAGAVTLDIVLENTRNTDASIVGQTVANVDLGGFLVVGVLIGVAFMLGVMLLLAGLRRANRKRQERKELERSYAGTATHAESLQEERDRLAAELEEERRARHHAERAVPAATGGSAATMGGHDDRRTTELPGTVERSGATERPTSERPATAANDAPIYPSEAATGPMPSTAGTATQERTDERTKPTLKQRLLGS